MNCMWFSETTQLKSQTGQAELPGAVGTRTTLLCDGQWIQHRLQIALHCPLCCASLPVREWDSLTWMWALEQLFPADITSCFLSAGITTLLPDEQPSSTFFPLCLDAQAFKTSVGCDISCYVHLTLWLQYCWVLPLNAYVILLCSLVLLCPSACFQRTVQPQELPADQSTAVTKLWGRRFCLLLHQDLHSKPHSWKSWFTSPTSSAVHLDKCLALTLSSEGLHYTSKQISRSMPQDGTNDCTTCTSAPDNWLF